MTVSWIETAPHFPALAFCRYFFLDHYPPTHEMFTCKIRSKANETEISITLMPVCCDRIMKWSVVCNAMWCTSVASLAEEHPVPLPGIWHSATFTSSLWRCYAIHWWIVVTVSFSSQGIHFSFHCWHTCASLGLSRNDCNRLSRRGESEAEVKGLRKAFL